MFLSCTRYSSRKRRIHGPRSSCFSMNHLPDIAFEAERCFRQQLRGHGQVDLSASEIDVAEVRRKSRQQTLNVQPTSIPGDHAVHGKGVSQIVNAWLLASRCRPDADVMSELSKAGFQHTARYGSSIIVCKKG